MKRIFLIFIFAVTLSITIDAQAHKWHYRRCYQPDIDNCTPAGFECMWNHANRIIWIGTGTILIGTTLIVIPFVEPTEINTGVALLLTGIVIDAMGAGLFVTGVHRKVVLKKSAYYNIYKTGSLNIQPTLGLSQINNSPYIGITLSLDF
jgi:hypothetical protein